MQLRAAPGRVPGELIAVIGAGIGGLALGGALARYGIACRLFEKTRELAEVGAGTELSPYAFQRLRQLGLGPVLRERGVAIEAIEVRTDDGRLVTRRPLGAPFLTLHRAHLHAALLSLIDPECLRLGHRLVSARESEDGALLTFDDGAVLRADVAVGADGVHSAVRAALHHDAPVPSGLAMYRGVLPADSLPPAATEPVVRIWLGRGGHFTCYPIAAGAQVSFSALVVPGPDAAREPGRFVGWPGLAGAIADAAGDMSSWPVYDRHPLDSWSTRHMTLLGDAAHAMLPLLAQGPGQAIEDAMELASGLADGPVRDAGARLARYAARRIPRTRAMQRAARRTADVLRRTAAELTTHAPPSSAAIENRCTTARKQDLEMSRNG